MDQNLLRAYFSTVYELPSPEGTVRASLDGEMPKEETALPEVLRKRFAIVTDEGWIDGAVRWLGWLLPGDVQVFGTAERDTAERWVQASDPNELT